MFAIRLGRDNPRHLRQSAVAHVVAEDVHESGGFAVVRQDVGSGAGSFGQRRSGQGELILMEVEERIVSVVADVGIVRPAPETGRVQTDADVLIDVP